MTALTGEMRRVLVDTSAYYALADGSDSSHNKAVELARRLAVERWRLFTTNFVLAETHALLLRRAGRELARRVVRDIREGSVSVVRVTATDEEKAWALIDQYADKDFSFTDAASFIVAGRLGISHAFSFDRNFWQYGMSAIS